MTLLELRDLLLTIGPPVSHYHAHNQPDKYIVWAEYGRMLMGRIINKTYGENNSRQRVKRGNILPTYFVYLIYTAVLVTILTISVPRLEIRRLSIYGILFGGVVDLCLIIFLSMILGIFKYKNFGPLGVLGMPFLPLFAWSVFFIMFFYFLPGRKPWNCYYILAAAVYSTIFSNVLSNLGILELYYGKFIVPFIIYISWFGGAAWAYLKWKDDLF